MVNILLTIPHKPSFTICFLDKFGVIMVNNVILP